MLLVDQNCLSCLSLHGTQRIPPGPPIFKSRYYTIEHKSQSPIPGWLVIVLNQHKERLNQLEPGEYREFGILLPEIIACLHTTLEYETEYVCQFAAKAGFKHIHWHVIPVPHGLPAHYRGYHIFDMIKDHPALTDAEIIDLTATLARVFTERLSEFTF